MRDVPPAEGVRLHWDAMPQEVRKEVETILGSPVTSAVTQPLGFSPGVAVRLETMSGRRAFAKAVPPRPNPISPLLHRREIRILSAMPAAAPIARLIEAIDQGEDGWVVLVLEDIDGASPTLPWQPAQLALALSAIESLHGSLTPPPTEFEPAARLLASSGFQRWRTATGAELDRLDPWSREHIDLLVELEAQAPEASRGNTPLHLDLRADNLLVNAHRAWVVDWAHAGTGAPWVDYVGFAASVEMQGGPTCEELLAMAPPHRRGDDDAINAVLASLAGMFSIGGLQPPQPGLPTVRAFQFAQGIPARRWLAERLV